MFASLWQLKLVFDFVSKIFPRVDQELAVCRETLRSCPSQELVNQALRSIDSKRFHAQGGSIYALYPGVPAGTLVPLIVSLQTISDYLDNLCDRAGCFDEAAFRQLHLAMTEALCPGDKVSPYYSLYPYREDGGYLTDLVERCRAEVQKLPSYHLVQEKVLDLARLYSELQTYKHVEQSRREKLLSSWAEPYLKKHKEITCWEFAAATGSTLGIFMLAAAAASPRLTCRLAEEIVAAYFPWICGLHILLDYFIDQEEDRQEQDFNFVSYYSGEAQCQERLLFFLHKSREKALALPNPLFHLTVIEGLLAMYLSDPKARQGSLAKISSRLIKAAGPRTALLHKLCCRLRARNVI